MNTKISQCSMAPANKRTHSIYAAVDNNQIRCLKFMFGLIHFSSSNLYQFVVLHEVRENKKAK